MRWRLLAGVALGALLAGAACGGDDDEGGADEIEIDAPAGWQEVPLKSLGFGLAVPGDWEAVVLSDQGLQVLERADPDVPDFATSAHAAHQTGAVFYAAGLDDANEDQVNDLKVLADTASEVEDLAGLEDYARAMIRANGLENATVTAVDDAPEPTVDVRYQATGRVGGQGDDSGEAAQSGEPESGGGTEEGDAEDESIVVEGVKRFVLAPVGAVYVFVITGEDAASIDDLAPRLLDAVTLAS